MFGGVFTWAKLPSFLFSVLRISTPLIYGGLSAVITQKSGLLNMAIESMMLASALTGVLIGGFTHSAIIGALAGVAAAVLITLILSYNTFKLRVDLYLASIAMNTALSGGTVFIMFLVIGQKSNTIGHINSPVLPNIDIPLLKDIPILGEVLSGHNILTYFAFVATFILWYLITKTKLGLRIRAVGENPQAAISVGIDPVKIYFLTFAIAGILAGLGGVFMSMGYTSWFQRDMIAGRGFIGMSTTNVTGGDPLPTAIAAMIFGVTQALTNMLQLTSISPDIISAVPYGGTILILLFTAMINNIRYAANAKKVREKQQQIAET